MFFQAVLGIDVCANRFQASSKPLSRSNSDQTRLYPTDGTSDTVEHIVVGPWVPYRNYGMRQAGYENSRYVTNLQSTAPKTPPAPRNLRKISSIPVIRPAHRGIMPKVFGRVTGLFRHPTKRVKGEENENRKKEKGKGKGRGKERNLLA